MKTISKDGLCHAPDRQGGTGKEPVSGALSGPGGDLRGEGQTHGPGACLYRVAARSDSFGAEASGGRSGKQGAGTAGGDGQGRGEEQEREGQNPGDELLIERICTGEPDALGELWKRYMGLLFSQILRVLQNASEAEDVAVEVFFEVWRRAKSYHPERARPAAWLVTLARRRAIDRLRERTSYEQARKGLALECAASRAVLAGGAGESARLEGLRAILEQALNNLPAEQKTTVLKVFFEGLSQREISRRTGVPVGTVKTRLELGLRKLRDRLLWRRSRCFGTLDEDFPGPPPPLGARGQARASPTHTP